MAWYDGINATVEHNGANIPMREHPFVKEAPDLDTFVKRAFDTHREVGSRVPINVKPEEVQNWRKEHMPKLYKAGILDAPHDTPDKYFPKPEKLADGLSWDDNLAKNVGAVMHKHGVSGAAAQELSKTWTDWLTGMQASNVKAMTDELATVQKGLRDEFKEKYDERLESARRLAKATMDKPELMEADPDLFPIFMRLGPLAESDSSFLRDANKGGGGSQSADAAWREYNDIISNKENPRFEKYWKTDPDTVKYVNDLATKAFPGERTLR